MVKLFNVSLRNPIEYGTPRGGKMEIRIQPIKIKDEGGERKHKGTILAVSLLAAVLVSFLDTAASAGPCDVARELTNKGKVLRDYSSREANFYETAVRLCPQQGEAHYLLATIYEKQGKMGSATYEYQEAERLGFKPPSLPKVAQKDSSSKTGGPLSGGTAATDSPAVPAPEEDVSPTVLDKWALVVGIGKFQDRRINPLRYTAKDARDIYDFLVDSKVGRFKRDHVWKLIDEEATIANLRQAIGQLSLKAQRDDLVVIYLSSHGSPKSLDLTANEEEKQVSYIVTHDTRLDDAASLYATAFPMRDFEDIVENRLRARRVVIFMDTCYSAGVFQGVQVASLVGGKGLVEERLGVSRRMVDKLAQGTGRVIITSSNSNERSWESDELKNGYFTHYLLQGLRQKGGLVPIEKVYNHLRDNVPRRVKKDKGQLQNPVLGKSVRGPEIVIGAPVD